MSRLSDEKPDNWRPRNFTCDELAECADREVSKRKSVYPRRVADQKLSPVTAAREIAMMTEIGAVFRRLAASERLL